MKIQVHTNSSKNNLKMEATKMKKEIIGECNCQYCGKELKQEGFRFEIGGT